MKITKRNPI
jgi:ubiquinol-cytochrome c reductase cytochrome b subunit